MSLGLDEVISISLLELLAICQGGNLVGIALKSPDLLFSSVTFVPLESGSAVELQNLGRNTCLCRLTPRAFFRRKASGFPQLFSGREQERSLPVGSPARFSLKGVPEDAARPLGHRRLRASLANAQRFPGRALGWTCWLLSARRSEPSGQRGGGAGGTHELGDLLPPQAFRRRLGVGAHDTVRRGVSGAAPASHPPAARVVAAVGVFPAGRPAWAHLGAGRAGCAAGGGTKGRLPVVAYGPPLQLVVLSGEEDVREERARCRCGETAGFHRGGSCRAGCA